VISAVFPGMFLGALSAGFALLMGSSLLMTLVTYCLVASSVTLAIGLAMSILSRPLDLGQVARRGLGEPAASLRTSEVRGRG
jgi:hypothetical protein